MRVTFYRQRPTGKDKIGSIALKDGALVLDPPDSIALQNVLDQPVRVFDGDGNAIHTIESGLNPKMFIENLAKQYIGTYFWAEESNS